MNDIETMTNRNEKKVIQVVIPQNQKYELELGIANLITKFYSGEKVSNQTDEAITNHMESARKILVESGNMQPSKFVPTTKLKFAQLQTYKMYKNINTFSDQWYMKIVEGNKPLLITGSKYSNYKFSVSSATLNGAVFVEFRTELIDR